jgi:hypothetical protein
MGNDKRFLFLACAIMFAILAVIQLYLIYNQ